MSIATKTIRGYHCEILAGADCDREDNQCFISSGGASGSLAAAASAGVLLNARGNDVPISAAAVDEINAWARLYGAQEYD